MHGMKKCLQIFRKIPMQVVGVLLLVLLAVLLLWFNSANSNQAIGAVAAQVRFAGEYRIGSGSWQTIEEGQHIPATRGDVILRGNFHLYTPDGEYIGIFSGKAPIAFYTNHINVMFREGEGEPYVADHENPLFGVSACGVDWTAHAFTGDGTEPIEIVIRNPHRFGNDTAVDELLASTAIWGNIDFERDILDSGKIQRNTGLLFVIVSLVLLGTALFSALLHVHGNRIICILGLTVFFAGLYLAYSAPGVSFWSASTSLNTTIRGISMMFYMLFLVITITCFLQKTKKVGMITTAALGLVMGIYFILPMVSATSFYDTWLFWVITQTAANVVLLVCQIREHTSAPENRWVHAGLITLLLAFEADAAAVAAGLWSGGLISKYVFLALFAAALFVVLRIIPESINAAARTQELELQRSRLEAEKNIMEAELKESRISIMLSQIQPHFIYNTLGTIERMCLKDPEKAFDLVRNFSLYLRGNFSELDSVTPIRFAEELKHVEYYVHIEKVRFPDMNIVYEVETTDFVLPALSVQPLVENAIKHGLMRLESGGMVVIRSYETPSHFCVEVKDDGVGFDPSLPVEEKKHVGLRNIRGRLKAMVNGELIIESAPDTGTRAIIMIPKEVVL